MRYVHCTLDFSAFVAHCPLPSHPTSKLSPAQIQLCIQAGDSFFGSRKVKALTRDIHRYQKEKGYRSPQRAEAFG